MLATISVAHAGVSVVPQSRSAAQLQPQSARIEAQIEGASGFAQVKETWTFANSAQENFEAELVCQAPKNAVMTGFAYYFRGERVVARVVEKTRAANIYNIFNPVNVPMAARRDPAIAEMLARNLLKVRVGPVEAKRPLVIELLYAQPLEARGDKQIFPLQLRDGAPLKLESFAFTAQGAPDVAALSLGQNTSDFKAKDFALPPTATLEFAVPARAAMLQSDGKSGYFAAILSEAQWKTRASWKGASDIVSKVLDAQRVLVSGKFAGESPAKIVGMKPQRAATSPRLWWMALQIESLESNPNNYKRVVELSNASNLPSAFSSWLAIPASERKAMEERMHSRDDGEESAQIDRLGKALASWKAMGKTNTPQYRAMLSDFEARWAKSKGSDNKEALKNYGKTYVYWLRNTLERYAETTEELSGAKLHSFALQFERLGAKDYRKDLQKARDTLARRRVSKILLTAASQGKTVDLATLPAAERDRFLSQLTAASVRARLTNPALASRLRVVAKRAAIAWNLNLEYSIRSAEYSVYGLQISEARSAYANAIIKGEENTPKGRQLASHFQNLIARTEFLGHEGLGLSETIGKLAVEKQFQELVETPNATEIARLQREIERLSRLADFTPQRVEVLRRQQSQYSQYLLMPLLARENLLNGSETARAQKLKALLPDSDPKAFEYEMTYTERDVLSDIAQPLLDDYFAQTTELVPDASRVAELTEQIQALAARSTYNKNFFAAVTAPDKAVGRQQSALVAKILDESHKPAPDQKRIEAWSQHLGQIAADSKQDYIYQRFWLDNAEGKGRGTPQQYGEVRAQRIIVQDQISRAKQKFAADKTDSLKVRAQYDEQIAELRQRENQLRVRMGDPLIAVKAPADARHVLAITPDGTLVPLEFDALSGEWQARFDVPTYVSSGDYAIQIIVVFAGGARQQLQMHLSVDLSAPHGVAAWKREGDGILISLETDEQTQRVMAFTPWNERVELKRDESGVWSSHVALPAGFEGGKLRFIVTDKAHNRTEITLDLSDDKPEN